MRAIGILVAALSLLALGGCKKSESVAVGGECSERDDCVNRNDCLKLGNGKGVCTKSCLPSSSDCPPPTTCQSVNLSIDVPGKTVNVPKVNRCLPQ